MGRGMNSYGTKEKRAMRRRNHIARDLGNRKYHQRRVEHKKEDKYPTDWESENE